MIRTIAVAAFTAIALAGVTAPPVEGQEPYPFVGRWAEDRAGCTTPFVYTAQGYGAPGERVQRWRAVRREGRGWRITMPDGYVTMVQLMPNGRLSWLSGASGDGFELLRCP